MSFIDEFLDFTSILPRDVIRLLKLIKEVDEKSVETNKKLTDSRKLYLSKQKTKSGEKDINDLYNTIHSNYLTAISLSLTKEEIIKELQYLLFTHNLENLSRIIEKGEKECAANAQINLTNGITPQSAPLSFLADSKQSIEDNFSISALSSKKNKNLKDSKLLGKKKNRLKQAKNKKNGNNQITLNSVDIPQPIDSDIAHAGEIGEGLEQVYCFCKGPSYGNMIECDNLKCPIQWFHYDCVGITVKPNDSEKWFCSEECKEQFLLKEEKGVKKKKKKNN